MKNQKIARRFLKNFWQSPIAGGNAGRDYSKSASGFCSKKVRTSFKKHRQVLDEIDRIYPRLFRKNYRRVHLQYLVLRKASRLFHN